MTHSSPRPLCALAVVATGLLAACSTTANTVPASFSSPTGLAVAGVDADGNPKHDLLFIANTAEDTLQVGQLTSELKTFDFVRGDALHFPLRIPAGPQPTRLAATPNGRYVVVLNGSGESVRLIDAQGLVPAVSGGEMVVTAVGPSGSVPADMVAAPATPTAPNGVGCVDPSCKGRFYVSLSGVGVVMALEVREQADPQDASKTVPSLVLARAYQVGGTPVSLAIHPEGRMLYVTDATSSDTTRPTGAVMSLDLQTGQVLERISIDDAPGAAAISADGTILAVARPRLKDLVIIADLSTGVPTQLDVNSVPTQFDANSAIAPLPACLDSCDALGVLTTSVCSGEHPADQEVCSTGKGLAAVAPPRTYKALYLGRTPTRIAALGATSGQNVSVPCGSNPIQYSQALVVGSSGGELLYVGLRDANDGFSPQVISLGACNPPSVAASAKVTHKDVPAPTIADMLGPCPATPPGRARFHCTDPAGGPGVVVLPGATGGAGVTLDWEGVVWEHGTGGRFETHAPAAGSTEAAIQFYDQDRDPTDVRPGDILQIVTPPRQVDECKAAIGPTLPLCLLEWHILSIQAGADGHPRMILETRGQDAVPSCFGTDGTIAYRVRSGRLTTNPDGTVNTSGTYLVTRGSQRLGRADPGDDVGIGSSIAGALPLLFNMKDRTVPDDRDTCAFYDDPNGLAKDVVVAGEDFSRRQLFSRNNPFGFAASDTYNPIVAGPQFFGSSASGLLPGDMVLVQLPGSTTIDLFVTYTAGNALLGYEPYDISKLTEADRYRVIR